MRVIIPPSGNRYHEIQNDSENIETECGLSIEQEEARFLGPERQAKRNEFEKCAKCSDPDEPRVY